MLYTVYYIADECHEHHILALVPQLTLQDVPSLHVCIAHCLSKKTCRSIDLTQVYGKTFKCRLHKQTMYTDPENYRKNLKYYHCNVGKIFHFKEWYFHTGTSCAPYIMIVMWLFCLTINFHVFSTCSRYMSARARIHSW